MKRPWQIWLVFSLCLAVMLPAMGWLTIKALELDAAEGRARKNLRVAQADAETARRWAELEKDVSEALWRMDTYLTPIIANEATRPYYVFRPFYTTQAGGKSGPVAAPSPLLASTSEHVRLHFQCSQDGQCISPQAPSGKLQAAAGKFGVTADQVKAAQAELARLSPRLTSGDLWKRLPESSLPPVQVAEAPSSRPGAQPTAQQPGPYFLNAVPLAKLQQKLKDVGQESALQPQQGDQQTNAPRRSAAPAAQPTATPPQQGQSRQAPDPQAPKHESPQQLAAYGADFGRRNLRVQSSTQRMLVQNRAGSPAPPSAKLVREGVSRPFWLDEKLILARRVVLGDQTLMQGAWLDWPGLRRALLAEVADVMPGARLVPVREESDIHPGRMLASLPVELVVPAAAKPAPVESPAETGTALSPIRASLILAWIGVLVAACAVAVVLRKVVALSERRAAFVSAVTHELRTPLTTFRMYAEMLSAGMVRDEQKKQQYADTLRVEADRLTHLVGNVLSYARLERGSAEDRRETVSVESLIHRAKSRLLERAADAGMELRLTGIEDCDDARVHTDVSAVEQILFNLVDNCCKYAARAENREIALTAACDGRHLKIAVRDHGPGIDPKIAARLFQPFSKSVEEAAHSAPGVGLGLALCRRLAGQLGGALSYARPNGGGACFTLELPLAG